MAGSFINAYVMSVMKVQTAGRGFALRAMASTVAGETVDSLIFFPIALGGVVPWATLPAMMLSQVALKTLYEAAVLPLTACVVRRLKRIEGEDAYDRGISYNILNIKDL